MKITFTADIHIKLGAKNVPIEWSLNRYNLLIDELVRISNTTDMLIIGGDIFDKMPTMQELEIYYDLVANILVPCIIYPGNHESVKKETTFLTHLKKSTNRLNKLVTIVDDYYSCNDFDIIPYNRLKDYEKNTDNTFVSLHNKILFTHVRGAIEPHVKPEIDLSLLDKWDLVLAGDLHSYENSQRNIIYPGSPCTTSFHRSVVDTGVVICDTDDLTHTWEKLELPQLLRKTIRAGEPMEPTTFHHTIYEVEGSLAELGAMEDSELIGKKVTKRETDTALILDPKMSLQEELKEYLTYILQLSEEETEAAVHVLNNSLHKITDD